MQVILELTDKEGEQLQDIAHRLKLTRHQLVTRWAKEHLVVDAANVRTNPPDGQPKG